MMIYSIYWIKRAHCLLSNHMCILLYVYVHSKINNNLIYYIVIVLLFLLSPFTLCTFRCRRCIAAFILVIFNTYRLPRPVQQTRYHHPSFHQQHPSSTTINIACHHEQTIDSGWQPYLQPRWRRDHHHRWVKMPIIDRCCVHVDGDSFLPKREVDSTIVGVASLCCFGPRGNYRGYN